MAAMTPARKRIALAIVWIGGALIAERVIALSGDSGDEVVAAVPAKRASAPTAPRTSAKTAGASASLRLDRLDDRQHALQDPDGADQPPPPGLFTSTNWAPPPPPAPPPEAAPAPVAPPFPYEYMGKLLEDGVLTAFFMQGNRVLSLKAGDTVDSVYRVDQMTGEQMNLTFLPLKQSQVVRLGNTP
jgi:hypothetical protein